MKCILSVVCIGLALAVAESKLIPKSNGKHLCTSDALQPNTADLCGKTYFNCTGHDGENIGETECPPGQLFSPLLSIRNCRPAAEVCELEDCANAAECLTGSCNEGDPLEVDPANYCGNSYLDCDPGTLEPIIRVCDNSSQLFNPITLQCDNRGDVCSIDQCLGNPNCACDGVYPQPDPANVCGNSYLECDRETQEPIIRVCSSDETELFNPNTNKCEPRASVCDLSVCEGNHNCGSCNPDDPLEVDPANQCGNSYLDCDDSTLEPIIRVCNDSTLLFNPITLRCELRAGVCELSICQGNPNCGSCDPSDPPEVDPANRCGNSYLECDEDTLQPIIRVCPAGESFNPDTLQCDDQVTVCSLAECLGSPNCGCACPPFRCPDEFGYFGNPCDCTSYYTCSFWIAEIEYCPTGLLYDSISLNCIEPLNAVCRNECYDFKKNPLLRH